MHTIRLRRPWLRSVEGQTGSGKVDVPDVRSVPGAGKPVTYRRSFNQPTGLESHERVDLVIDRFSGASICVSLNGERIDAGDATFPLRIDVTARLEHSNRLEVQLEPGADGKAVLDGAVTLQIL